MLCPRVPQVYRGDIRTRLTANGDPVADRGPSSDFSGISHAADWGICPNAPLRVTAPAAIPNNNRGISPRAWWHVACTYMQAACKWRGCMGQANTSGRKIL